LDFGGRAQLGFRDHHANQIVGDDLYLRTYQSGQRSSVTQDDERTSRILPNRSDVRHTSLFDHRMDDLSS
jgi:hypothetical protein